MPFSLTKLKTKVGRRFSDPADFDRSSFVADHRRNSIVILVTEPEALRESSTLSIPSEMAPRSRLRSVSKKQAKELIRQETSHVIQKKLFTLLKDLGLQLPIPLKTSAGVLSAAPLKLVKVYVANTHDCVYLAPSLATSFTYEDVENGGNDIPESTSAADINGGLEENVPFTTESTPRLSVCSISDNSETGLPDISSAIIETISKKIRALKSANYLCTQIDSLTPIPHLFAVIVELQKDTSIKTMEVEFLSTTRTQWPVTDSSSRHHFEDKFKIGKLKWDLNFQDADFYINVNNTKDTRLRDIDPQHLAKKTREFRLVDSREKSSHSFDELFSHSSEFFSLEGLEPSADIQKAGLYVFLLPILLPPNIPASVNTVNGTLTHKLAVKLPGPQERLSKKTAVKADYNLPLVRTPPSSAYSIADKPIYINRVWNDALHYSIVFPRKYVSLGSEHTINVKLIPMAKDVIVKRIKFNILERVTYVSKDLSKEYEYDGDDPFARSKNPKAKERIVALCELRTRSKNNYNGLEPFKEEVLNCPENNLLYSCYEQKFCREDSSNPKDRSVMVASPLDINIALPFLTSRADKELLTSGFGEHDRATDSTLSTPNSRGHSVSKRGLVASLESPSLPIIGSLETHISHSHGGQFFSDADEDILKLDSSSLLPKKYNGRDYGMSRGYTISSKALSPDSNFRHIQVSHRLQVSFRISKPDTADNNKMHHYEVVVDTPIVLLSAKCSDDALQLPEYAETKTAETKTGNDATLPERPGAINFRTPSYVGNGIRIRPFDPAVGDLLPSFEEATMPSSTTMRSSSVTSLDPSTPANPPAYEHIPHGGFDSSQEATIDDVLVDASRALRRKPSAIRASLESSFAHPHSSASQASSSSEVSPIEGLTRSLNSDLMSSSTSSEDLSSLSLQSVLRSTSELDSGSAGLVDGAIGAANADDSSESLADPVDLDSESITTGDMQFDQRLPLLRNESMNDAEANAKTIIKNRGLATSDWSKMLMETLNEESQPQSLFHAC
ncbi:hypothetical protein METBIDRAFT_29846 [Metschnikowia bicuspidata var. bicuspidata NRRL YB-4993]|uniref:Arrestin C-terminal-like domain-containing protein n=1 Tax=Metschnikowia bicuspidata var. bicuspidata NRRL YB-4993 TaxID=869754 RepID=A0A1A0HHM7_9ASCO|nr:hypothetical protein METBIDRAFT_29846 [Metschnikowia bicuspidata var. bicuspidata NRRL YB-4993]OBA23348.1 hypothetical protein METBIDRAFT_29846 [Metschnikowia bicuspidata var. bicuspidata NRRL YB-4993]